VVLSALPISWSPPPTRRTAARPLENDFSRLDEKSEEGTTGGTGRLVGVREERGMPKEGVLYEEGALIETWEGQATHHHTRPPT
jgi:hypothetical protein